MQPKELTKLLLDSLSLARLVSQELFAECLQTGASSQHAGMPEQSEEPLSSPIY